MRLQPLVGPSSVLLSTSERTGRCFLRLPHPRSGQPALFLPFSGDGGARSTSPSRCDRNVNGAEAETEGYGGILELQAVVGQSDAEKSWFVMREQASDQVISDGTVLLLTPMDPVFLLLSLLLCLSSTDPFAEPAAAGPGQSRFETTESLFDRATTCWTGDASAADPVLAKDVEAFTNLPILRHALPRICDALDSQQDADDGEKLWRLSREKVLAEMGKKVDRIAQASEKAGEAAKADGKNEGEVMATGLMLVKEELDDVGGVPENVMRGEPDHDARKKIALDIVAGYLPPSVAAALRRSQPLPHLTSHRAAIAARLKTLAATAQQPGRSSSSSNLDDDLGGGKAAALKKAKAKSQKGSRGVEALKKASTRGMSKLGDMWGKAKEKAKEKAEAVVEAVVDGEGQKGNAQVDRVEADDSAKAATGQDAVGTTAKEGKRKRTTTEESAGKKARTG